jgi:hypothetical protein
VALSSNGRTLVAVGAPSIEDWTGFLEDPGPYPKAAYLSPDLGQTWVTDSPAGDWLAVAASADGSDIVAVGDGLIAVLRSPAPTPPSPLASRLSIGRSGANLVLSWLVPSTSVVLQQSSDLSSPNWATVTNPPSLNFTNLHHDLTLTPKSSPSFYRLKLQ